MGAFSRVAYRELSFRIIMIVDIHPFPGLPKSVALCFIILPPTGHRNNTAPYAKLNKIHDSS
jgi:hypothetical protein